MKRSNGEKRNVQKQIVAMGGGFSMDATTLMDDFVLGLTGKRRADALEWMNQAI